MLYWKPPTAADLVNESYVLSDFAEPDVEVWDEHWDVLHLFIAYSTQFRSGMNGPVSLDFNVFHHALDRKGVKGDEYDVWIDKLRTIEGVALKHIHSRT